MNFYEGRISYQAQAAARNADAGRTVRALKVSVNSGRAANFGAHLPFSNVITQPSGNL